MKILVTSFIDRFIKEIFPEEEKSVLNQIHVAIIATTFEYKKKTLMEENTELTVDEEDEEI